MNDKHFILKYQEEGKTYILDTGSPYSIHYGNEPIHHTLNKLYPNLLNDLTELLGEPIDGLMGLDTLRKNRWTFNAITQTIEKDSKIRHTKSIRFETHLGVPVIECKLDSRTYRFLVDTGSSVCYLQEDRFNYERNLIFEDYSPFMGKFKTEGHRVSIEALNQKIDCDVFILPKAYESMLGLDVDGILGCNFLRWFSWTLSLNSDQILVEYGLTESGLFINPSMFI